MTPIIKTLYRLPTPKSVEVRYPGFKLEFEPMGELGNELYLYLTPEQVQEAALAGVKCTAVAPR